jgi:hypothetical protein
MYMEGNGALSGREIRIELTQERMRGVTTKLSHPKKEGKGKVSRSLIWRQKSLAPKEAIWSSPKAWLIAFLLEPML